MSSPSYNHDRGPHYIVFDKTNGNILHTHARFSVEHNKNVEVPLDELKAMFAKDPSIVHRVTGKDPANLDVIAEYGAERARSSALLKVDVDTGKLVPKPVLSLKSKKKEIAGDGQDSTTIDIHAVDHDGKAVHDLDTTVKVTTTRGKLSARGGVVEMRRGHAQITLTSVNETADRVLVTATARDGACGRGTLILEFV